MEVVFNQYENKLINELYDCYCSNEKFNSNTIEGVELKGRKVYGLRWDFVKLYFDTNFCIDYYPEERIAILNALLEEFVCNKTITNKANQLRKKIVQKNLLTREYIEVVRKDELFENTYKSKIISTFTQLRHKLIKEKLKNHCYIRY